MNVKEPKSLVSQKISQNLSTLLLDPSDAAKLPNRSLYPSIPSVSLSSLELCTDCAAYRNFPARFKPKSIKIEEKWCSHAEFAKYLDLLIFQRFLSVVHNQIYLTSRRYSLSLRHKYYF
jgi:hypothetical protein